MHSFEINVSEGPLRSASGICRRCKRHWPGRRFACSCGVLLLIVAYVLAAFHSAGKLIHISPQVKNITDVDGWPWTPANVTESWHRSYGGLGMCTSDELLEAFREFSGSQPHKRVYFKSRLGDAGQDVVRLAGWWLPAAESPGLSAEERPPRIVISHGFQRNSLDHTVQLTGYMLRSMGISVLLVDLRDHGASAVSAHPLVLWGWAFPFDLLGAWDYAVKDPDGELGGPAGPERVGVMGFSMGGYVAATAFGMDHQVPAAWLDSPLIHLQETLHAQIKRKLFGMWVIPQLIAPLALRIAEWQAGVDLEEHCPSKSLGEARAGYRMAMSGQASVPGSMPRSMASEGAAAPLPRPVAVLGNELDDKTPPSQQRGILDLLYASPASYDVREDWMPRMRCGLATHVTLHNWRPAEYSARLCKFWHGALEGGNASLCRGLRSFADCPWDECPEWPWAST